MTLPVVKRWRLLIVFAAVLICLLAIANAGIHYIFDNDELYHVNLVYLYAKGYVPYNDVYNSIYTPLFQWAISPIFFLLGFSFSTIALVRYGMFLLLVGRLIGTYLIAQRIAGARGGWIALLLLVWEPITAYTAMQVRPDNLMMTFFIWGLVCLFYAKKRVWLTCICALLFSLSALTLMKIAPTIALIFLIMGVNMVRNKSTKELQAMIMGAFAPVVLFFLYTLMAGNTVGMLQQSVKEAVTSYAQFDYPVPFGFFYKPDNINIFGLPGRPLSWMFVQLFLVLGAIGGIYAGVLLFNKNVADGEKRYLVILLTAAFSQILLLHWYTSIFVQHYLVLHGLLAIFGGVFLAKVYALVSKKVTPPFSFYLLPFAFCIPVFLFTYGTLEAQGARAQMHGEDVIAKAQRWWRLIPSDASSLPNTLFRPLSYPIPYGQYMGNIADSILIRLPTMEYSLEKNRVPFLILGDWNLRFIKPDTYRYIEKHYTRVPGEEELWTRN